MKAVLFVILFLSGVAQASNLKEITADQCQIKTFLANPFTKVFRVEGSQKTGMSAYYEAKSLKADGAKVTGLYDTLGVQRAAEYVKSTAVDKNGDPTDQCRGVTTVSLVRLCTVGEDRRTAACETRCSHSWVGEDCR